MSLVVAVFFPPELYVDLFEGYFVIVVMDLCQLFFKFDATVVFRLYPGTLLRMEDGFFVDYVFGKCN